MSSKVTIFLLLSVEVFVYAIWRPKSTMLASRPTEPICIGDQCQIPLQSTKTTGTALQGAETPQASVATAGSQNLTNWPPKLGAAFPDLELVDHMGQAVRLSSLKGKVLLFEPIGMTCPACQAFSGAHRFGAYGGVVPQPGLQSIEELFPKYTNGMSLSDERIVFVQLIFYNMSMAVPSLDETKKWVDHFRLDRSPNTRVLRGTKELINDATFKLIPGFQLIDRDFILRSDAAGHHPPHGLFNDLLPMIPRLL